MTKLEGLKADLEAAEACFASYLADRRSSDVCDVVVKNYDATLDAYLAELKKTKET